MLSRKLKIYENNFLIDLDRENIKLPSSGNSTAGIVKILKMTLAPPGGRRELVLIRHIMCWHMHADLNFSAFSIEEFFGSKPVNDVKMHYNFCKVPYFSVKIS